MQTISELLKNSPILVELYKKVDQLRQLQQILSGFLTQELKEHTFVADLRENVIVLVTDNKICKTKLNYIKMDLLTHLRASNIAFAGVSSIKIIVDYELSVVLGKSSAIKS